ncbi:PTS system N-acetylglucosamine-specific IIB component (Glc family) /PTS system N-acetylglucosamine-specific IIC component (Glc family) [Halanaerobium saccharolyticum]|uniref:PTS system N-acetylglucosamine-specific IIB component (Glc family) /PTS system N-acetylglucosamine-specific IIC component (Glc family) n=1 Tax=Halanaerobium saccharolyticum TaxID=43595 RepID=A0A4V3G4J4_9FIRM|nr:N-acetylglucosamine-specific PTS transporter subunit IIBC [Halanaerobium saccharolyticum]RAK06346.1 PTS system N-acetylglucosamine-specific IIB component (Glc family) /PTS system N-acetylglucosamine-specific IIC component (Glc family) [Halanaerobium saccharolyticum]TDW00658.1 PTS system N-acetylglucosamine-specific IIB component (Glc family) /PTS system N-acetylglucosamine-specific IIC component (Glc family) [Halanaerobium saccharolyticum]TDX52271.1 PTS system N-acetylglucosamine-specific IIB
MKKIFSNLQKIGKSLMLPIAVLPAAALLLRLGAGDVFDIPFVMAAGSAIFDNLALLFGIGVAVGIAHDSSGAAGLAGAVSYFVITNATQSINSDINMGVLAGIIGGLLAGYLYNRYHDIELPDFLGFFGGKRFVPIVTGAASVVLAGVFGYIWPPIQNVIQMTGEWIINAGPIGVFVYGFLNRLLIPVGLHHVLNSFIWFVFGEFTTAAGEVVTGDLSRFFAGDPSAGFFMSGFFPMMMFGLPAAALAMYHSAKPENKKAVSGIFLSVGLTAFLTGITEPIEFAFMFLAPVLYVIHAGLTGLSMVVTYVLGIQHGFGFSAGAIDYFLNYGLATKPFLIIPLGIAAFVIYYSLFRFVIEKFDIPTPGRAEAEAGANSVSVMPDSQQKTANNAESTQAEITKASQYIDALGGAENINSIDACITRLRLEVKDSSRLDENKLKQLGATGVLKANKNNAQVVVGTKAELIAEKIKKELKQ